MSERQIEILEGEGFTVVYNSLIQDVRLRLATRAVLILMLSKPKSWDFSVRGMAAIAGVSKDTMSKMLDELAEAGYLRRKQQGRTRGRFDKGGYIVSGRPVFLADKPEFPDGMGAGDGAPLRRGRGTTPPADGGGTHRRWDAPGGANRAGRFTRPSEYQSSGPPAQTSAAFAAGSCTFCLGKKYQKPTRGAGDGALRSGRAPRGSPLTTFYGGTDAMDGFAQGSARAGCGEADVGAWRSQAPAGFTPASEYEMEGAPAEIQRSVCGGEAAVSCPNFSYTKESYAKKSPQENKEQENTKQDNPPIVPPGVTGLVREQGFAPPLEEAVLRWMQYKQERREAYRPTGLKTLLGRIKSKAQEFGAAAVADAIETAMSANWQGIVWDKLKKPAPQEPVRRKLE